MLFNCILSHEAIIREAYQDIVGVWTWGVGVTETSGHSICPRYVDRPQTLRWCLEMYLRLLRDIYAPAVRDAFEGTPLSEAEFGAALSFHYNTGAIATATWVAEWRRGEVEAARASFMNWRKPPQIIMNSSCCNRSTSLGPTSWGVKQNGSAMCVGSQAARHHAMLPGWSDAFRLCKRRFRPLTCCCCRRGPRRG